MDTAILYDQARNDEILEALVLDFKDAFMSIPLHPAERKYNCSYLPEGIVLKRDKLDDNEAEQGTFVVWNVLGFGGKAEPLDLCAGGFGSHALGPSLVLHVVPLPRCQTSRATVR